MAVQRKPLPAFTVSQVPSAQNNQYTKTAYFGMAGPVKLHQQQKTVTILNERDLLERQNTLPITTFRVVPKIKTM